ncbi:MAG: LysE family translocator [Desulfatiglandaceae bacterium]
MMTFVGNEDGVIPIETAVAFFAASLVLALVPGPDNIFVLTQSAVCGRGAGLIVTLGLCTGLIVHSTAVALGVAAVFQASLVAFTALKTAGACYLLYLAWQAFRASTAEIKPRGGAGLGPWGFYRRGIIMNVTNPKVSIFFLAFLPQFTDPARGPLTIQVMLLGAIFIVATILVFGSVAFLAGLIGEWLSRSEKAQHIINRLAGTVFTLLAVKLAFTHR